MSEKWRKLSRELKYNLGNKRQLKYYFLFATFNCKVQNESKKN